MIFKKEKMMELYEMVGEEHCYPLSDFADRFNSGIHSKPIILELMEKDIKGQMFCAEFGEFVSQGDCGVNYCEGYKPCNGISGRCRLLVHGSRGTGKMFKYDGASLNKVMI